MRFKTKYDTLQKKYTDLEEGARLQAIRNAIQSNDNVKFHDTEMVMGLLNRDSISVDLKDGSIGGLEDQISQISESRPFLVKETAKKDGSDKESESKDQLQQFPGQTPPPSGTPPQSSATGNRNAQASEEETMKRMLADFPAMSSLSK